MYPNIFAFLKSVQKSKLEELRCHKVVAVMSRIFYVLLLSSSQCSTSSNSHLTPEASTVPTVVHGLHSCISYRSENKTNIKIATFSQQKKYQK